MKKIELDSKNIEELSAAWIPGITSVSYDDWSMAFKDKPKQSQSRSQSFVPLDQRSENESSGSNHFRHAP